MLKLPDKINTIVLESSFRLKEKGSVFVSISKPVANENNAEQFLAALKKKYYDASHHCYSYKLADGTFKYSDDGEPNGSAGIRIFNAQNHFELTGLISVVVRYFGGIKLGVGPLARVYYESTLKNLEAAEKEERILHQKIQIGYEFGQLKSIHHLISKYSLTIQEKIYTPKPGMICLIPSTQAVKFSSEISDKFKPGISVQFIDDFTYF